MHWLVGSLVSAFDSSRCKVTWSDAKLERCSNMFCFIEEQLWAVYVSAALGYIKCNYHHKVLTERLVFIFTSMDNGIGTSINFHPKDTIPLNYPRTYLAHDVLLKKVEENRRRTLSQFCSTKGEEIMEGPREKLENTAYAAYLFVGKLHYKLMPYIDCEYHGSSYLMKLKAVYDTMEEKVVRYVSMHCRDDASHHVNVFMVKGLPHRASPRKEFPYWYFL